MDRCRHATTVGLKYHVAEKETPTMPRRGATPPRGAALPVDGVNAREITLWTHQPPNFSKHDFVLNPAYAPPQMSDGELFCIAAHAGEDAQRLVFLPAQAFADQDVIARQQQQLQLSVSRSLAALCGLSNRSSAVLRREPRAAHTLTHVELFFRDQYAGRADMWTLGMAMTETCVYVGQVVSLATGVRARVRRLFVHECSVLSGYVAPSTKPIFRSESATSTVLVQMSSEMWEFDESGEIHYEKMLHGFLPDLQRRWEAVGSNHLVSIVLFARVWYEEADRAYLAEQPVQFTPEGRMYIDYYKVVLDLQSSFHWPSAMRTLKEEFFRFQHDILLQPCTVGSRLAAPIREGYLDETNMGERVLMGRFAAAHEGNILEAVNLAMQPLDKHYVDRDLTRTGLALVLLTAGTGHFQVDKTLLRFTTQHVFELGISLDLVCLTQMPLHSVPMFHYKAPRMDHNDHGDPLFRDNAAPGAPIVTHYALPYWINCSFYNVGLDNPYWENRFVPHCRMDGMRMMDQLAQQKLALPYLYAPGALDALHRQTARERHDRDIFRDVTGTPSALPSAPTPGGIAPPTDSGSTQRSARQTTPHSGSRVRPRASSQASRASRTPSLVSLASLRSGAGLDEVGKAAPVVGETVATLVAVPRSSSTASHTPLWRRLFRDWRSPKTPLTHTASEASRSLSRALQPPHVQPMLMVQPETEPSTRLTEPSHVMPFESPPPLIEVPREPAPVPTRAVLSGQNAMLLRWQHVFLERTNRHTIKWWSMTSPVCLPLSTAYLPSERELTTGWHEYPYTVSVHSDTTSILLKRGMSTSPALAMLREMCAQRIAQGFQLVERPVLRPGATPGTRDARAYIVRHPSELLRPGNFADGDPVYLSTTQQIHCIAYQRHAGIIHVTRYVQHMPYNTTPRPYRCCIWPRLQPGYRAVDTQFVHPDPHEYNWPYLDSIIAGYEDSFTESLRYWRARFVLVPSEGPPPAMTASTGERLSDEEVRLLGMDRLAELFARVEYRVPGKPRHTRPARPLRFLPTTLDPSSSMHDDMFVEALIAINDELSPRGTPPLRRMHRDAAGRSLETLADELRAAESELRIYDRLWHRVLYPDTFTGADLVTWLCHAYDDIRTRDEAVDLGRRLQKEGHIEHILGAHGFLDGHYFVRIVRPISNFSTD